MMKSRVGITLLCSSLLAVGVAHAEDWTVAKNEDGIKVELSNVVGSEFKEYRGTTVIKANVAKIQAMQEDAAGACAWIHECKSQKLLKHDGDQAWTYTQFNAPFPVTDRDSVLHITTHTEADGTVVRDLEAAPAYIPDEKGFVRVTQIKGFWRLKPVQNGTEVTYQVRTQPGGVVPSWIANKFVVDAPFNTLKNLRAKAEQ